MVAVVAILWSLTGLVCGIIYLVRWARHGASSALGLIETHHQLQKHTDKYSTSLRGCDECRDWHRGVVYNWLNWRYVFGNLLGHVILGPLSLIGVISNPWRLELTKKEKDEHERRRSREVAS